MFLHWSAISERNPVLFLFVHPQFLYKLSKYLIGITTAVFFVQTDVKIKQEWLVLLMQKKPCHQIHCFRLNYKSVHGKAEDSNTFELLMQCLTKSCLKDELKGARLSALWHGWKPAEGPGAEHRGSAGSARGFPGSCYSHRCYAQGVGASAPTIWKANSKCVMFSD